MNTKTILNIKTEKVLKIEAQKTAEEFGIPLGTIMNAFLRQFVRTKEINLDMSPRPSKLLVEAIREAESEMAAMTKNDAKTPQQLISHLKNL